MDRDPEDVRLSPKTHTIIQPLHRLVGMFGFATFRPDLTQTLSARILDVDKSSRPHAWGLQKDHSHWEKQATPKEASTMTPIHASNMTPKEATNKDISKEIFKNKGRVYKFGIQRLREFLGANH